MCSPLCKAALCKFTLRGAYRSWSVSTSAEVDLRNFFEKKFLKDLQKTFLMIVLFSIQCHAASDPRRFLKKATQKLLNISSFAGQSLLFYSIALSFARRHSSREIIPSISDTQFILSTSHKDLKYPNLAESCSQVDAWRSISARICLSSLYHVRR